MKTVTLRTPVKSGAGNLIAAPGTYEVLSEEDGCVTVATPDHYAGIGRSSFRLRKTDRVAVVHNLSKTATTWSCDGCGHYGVLFTRAEYTAMVACPYAHLKTSTARGLR